MGYDMYTKKKGLSEDEGYFRLNIWGMGWMRNIILVGDPTLEEELVPFNDNSGKTVSKKVGKRIADALYAYLKLHAVGDMPYETKTRRMQFEEEVIKIFGAAEPAIEALTEEDIKTIRSFAEYNERATPYRVC